MKSSWLMGMLVIAFIFMGGFVAVIGVLFSYFGGQSCDSSNSIISISLILVVVGYCASFGSIGADAFLVSGIRCASATRREWIVNDIVNRGGVRCVCNVFRGFAEPG
jgi:hypothetical protein